MSAAAQKELEELDRLIEEQTNALPIGVQLARANADLASIEEQTKERRGILAQHRSQHAEMIAALDVNAEQINSFRFDIQRLEAVAAMDPTSTAGLTELLALVNIDQSIEVLFWWKKTSQSRLAAKARRVERAEQTYKAYEDRLAAAVSARDRLQKDFDAEKQRVHHARKQAWEAGWRGWPAGPEN